MDAYSAVYANLSKFYADSNDVHLDILIFKGWAMSFGPTFVHVLDTEGGYIKCPRLSTRGVVKVGQCSCSMAPKYFLKSLKYNCTYSELHEI